MCVGYSFLFYDNAYILFYYTYFLLCMETEYFLEIFTVYLSSICSLSQMFQKSQFLLHLWQSLTERSSTWSVIHYLCKSVYCLAKGQRQPSLIVYERCNRPTESDMCEKPGQISGRDRESKSWIERGQ